MEQLKINLFHIESILAKINLIQIKPPLQLMLKVQFALFVWILIFFLL